MSEQHRISAVILTFNEERNIERCLKSLEGVADEIIIIDSFSTDNTESICQGFGTRFVKRKWEGYSNAKNHGNDLATYDYILSLDADESLSDELRQNILAEKANFTSEAYSFHRLTNYCGKWIHHCGWYPDTKVRMWKKGKGKWCGSIHEQLILEKCSTKLLHGDIFHYSYYSLNEHFLKVDRYTDLMANESFVNKKSVPIYKTFLSPIFKFLKGYFLQLGFLDGYYGFIICFIAAYSTRIKYVKIRELNTDTTRENRHKTKLEIVVPKILSRQAQLFMTKAM